MNLRDGKRRFNKLQKKGTVLYEKLEAMHKEMKEIEKQVRKIEGDDYDFISVMFGGGMVIYRGDKTKEMSYEESQNSIYKGQVVEGYVDAMENSPFNADDIALQMFDEHRMPIGMLMPTPVAQEDKKNGAYVEQAIIELIEKNGDKYNMSTPECEIFLSEHKRNCIGCPTQTGCAKLVRLLMLNLLPGLHKPTGYQDFKNMMDRMQELSNKILKAKTMEELEDIPAY